MFFGPQSISFDDQDMIYHNNKQLSLKSGGLTKFTLALESIVFSPPNIDIVLRVPVLRRCFGSGKKIFQNGWLLDMVQNSHTGPPHQELRNEL